MRRKPAIRKSSEPEDSRLKRFFGVPAWIEELRASLPRDDDATLIVASQRGPQYLRLDPVEIERHIETARKHRNIALAIIASLLAVIVLAVATHFWSTASLRAEIELAAVQAEAQAAEVERLSKTLNVIAEAVPLSVSLAVRDGEFSEDEKIEKVVEFLQRKDSVFRTYVAATGAVMKDKVGSLMSDLAAAGFDRRMVRNLVSSSAGTGGLPLEPDVADIFSYYIDDKALTLYEELQSLGNFVSLLPSADPMRDARLTSGFGMRRHPITRRADMHAGVDFVSYNDTRIFAAGTGIVKFAGENGGYGNMVTVDHGHGIETLYAHMSRINVREGQRVTPNSVLGRMGNTGFSTGPHLHFEVRFNGRNVNPLKMFEVARNVQHQEK